MPGRDLDLLIDAARAAGEIALGFFRADPKVWQKDDGQGPVTEADIAIDEMLRERLLAARPEYGWLSEETVDGVGRMEREACFVVDPIDGTQSFIEGARDFAHSLAIVRNGVPTEGVVHLPAWNLLYAAEIGGGASLNSRAIRAADCRRFDNAIILGGERMFRPEHWRGEPPAKRQRQFRPSPANRLCLVAEGKFDATITFRDTWEWDVAAGALIASEAGAVATGRNGESFSFNRPKFKGSDGSVVLDVTGAFPDSNRADMIPHPSEPGMVVAAPALHAELIERICFAG